MELKKLFGTSRRGAALNYELKIYSIVNTHTHFDTGARCQAMIIDVGVSLDYKERQCLSCKVKIGIF